MGSSGALKPCPKCGQMCPEDVLRCPNCDASLRRFAFKLTPIVPGGGDPTVEIPRIALLLVIGVVLVLLFMFYFGSK
jgi:hypothetical protein